MRSKILSHLQKVIDDDIIAKEFGKRKNGAKLLESVQRDKDAHGAYVICRDAVESSAKKANQAGAFGPQEVLNALSRNNKTTLGRGATKYQGDAYKLQSNMKSRDESIKKAAERVVNRVNKAGIADAKRASAQLNKELAQLKETKQTARKD